MARTHAEIKALTAQKLQDTGMATFLTAELDQYMAEALVEIPRWVPRITKETLTTTASKELDISSIHNLLWVERLEYKVDLTPPTYRNWRNLYNGRIRMAISWTPAAGESAYLYCSRKHVLQKEIGTADTAGAIKTAAAIAATSLVLKSLGTGTINENTKLTIAGDSTEYEVTAAATIATNEATVYIYPALVAAAAADAVVTLALADSTLDDSEVHIEEIFAEYVAAKAKLSKKDSFARTSRTSNAFTNYFLSGKEQMKEVIADLRRMAPRSKRLEYPRD